MSPAAIRSLIVRTPASNFSRVRFERTSGAFRPRRRRLRQAALELALEELDLRARELVERGEILVGRHARVGDDQDPVLDVIERQHGVEQHEAGFVLGSGFRPGLRSLRLVHAAFSQASASAGSNAIEAS